MEDECCSTVYSWFDKCGIISNIRTHLRYNLVNALKNKDLNEKLNSNTPRSAKQYVYDLLIAEYLWNHNYVYTLSVFASEAPLLVNFNKHLRSSDEENSTNTRQKLQNDYVCHTLETLGIEPMKTKGQSIIKNYEENDVPLLLCILQYIRTKDDTSVITEKQSESKSIYSQGVQTVATGESIYREIRKISAAKKKLIHQKSLFDAQLKQKETELKEQTIIMENQLSILQQKLDQAQTLIQNYSIKEKEFDENKKQENLRILHKENELIMREKLLSQEANRLEKERDSYRQFEGNLKKLQDELSKVKRNIPETNQSCNLNVKDVQIQTDFESFISSRNERDLLHQEKKDLNGLVQEQQSRIEQLTNKVVYLSRKLEETQLKTSHGMEVPSIIRIVNSNTVVSESSSTEDILQDARTRLRRLEEKSIKADQNYFNFITNSSQ